VSQRDEIVQSIQKAATLAEQAALVSQLDAYDRDRIAMQAQADSIDLTDTIIRETLSPVAVHERSTAETDWLGEVQASYDDYANEISAEAAMWFGRTSDEVKSDPEEFTEQARGMARHTAGRYGEQSEAAERQFMDYVGFLRTQAASGLDQVQQQVDSFENPKTTPLPQDVFDTFQPEVHPINQGVSGTETSERAPLIQEIEGNSGQQVAPPDPSHHDESQEFAGPAPVEASPGSTQGESSGGGSCVPCADGSCADCSGGSCTCSHGKTAALFEPSLAISHVGNLDDFIAQFDKEALVKEAGKCPNCGGPPPAGEKCARCGHKLGEPLDKEAASGLDQVQQVVDSQENPRPEPLPTEVAYPWLLDGGQESEDQKKQESGGGHSASLAAFQRRAAYVAGLMDRPYEDLTDIERKEVRAFTATLQKRADQWSQPHEMPQPEVANSPYTTPEPPTGTYQEGVAEGASDWPDEAPTYNDASSSAPDFVRGHAQGYGDAAQADPTGGAQPGMLPPGAGGIGSYQTHAGSLQATASVQSIQVSASFTSPMETSDPQFAKGYRYAAKWTPKKPLVKKGSVPFEAGLYAGMSDNPDHQADWVKAHEAAATKYQDRHYIKRLRMHREFTKRAAKDLQGFQVEGCYLRPEQGLQATAATMTDLDSISPSTSPSPTGSTPINGPGRPGPLAGGADPAAAGGPSPYNGAEPYGAPVVPNLSVTHGQPTAIDTQPGAPVDAAAYQHLSPQTRAFRRTVQANLLQSHQGE
jgi:hypothetical protein